MNIGTRISILCIVALSAFFLIILALWDNSLLQAITSALFRAEFPAHAAIPNIIQYVYLGFSAASLAGGLFLYIVFRRTTSPEILFFVISVLTAGFVSLKAISDSLVPLMVSSEWYIWIYKSYLFFYLFSIAQYFLGGMFSNGVPFLKQNLFLFVSFFASFSLIAALPLGQTTTAEAGNLFHPLTYDGYIVITARLLEVSAVINYIAAALRNRNSQYLLLALALALLFTGLEMFLISASSSLSIVGAAVYAASAVFFAHRIYVIRLWN